MKILVWNGSPRKNGNTVRLLEAFEKGAKETGNEVTIVNVANMDIHGCLACEYCHGIGNGKCVQKDEMQDLYPLLREADMLVLASPIYYFTMTGQLISALNRTYALGPLTHIRKTALILCSCSPNMYEAAITQYKGVVSWWGAENAGIYTAPGIAHNHDLENTSPESVEQVYRFGKNLTA